MIYESRVSDGWVGFETRFVKALRRKIPFLFIGFYEEEKSKKQKRGFFISGHKGYWVPETGKERKLRTVGVPLIHKNTEILPALYKAIGHYLGHRKEELPAMAYFQHEQETFTA